jgi:hypothetical protein
MWPTRRRFHGLTLLLALIASLLLAFVPGRTAGADKTAGTLWHFDTGG